MHDVIDDNAPEPLQRNLYRIPREVDSFVNACCHTDAPDESMEIDVGVVIARGNNQGNDQPRFIVRMQQGQVLRCTHLYGDRTEWINDRRPQRHEWERRGEFRSEDLFFTLSFRHTLKCMYRMNHHQRRSI